MFYELQYSMAKNTCAFFNISTKKINSFQGLFNRLSKEKPRKETEESRKTWAKIERRKEENQERGT